MRKLLNRVWIAVLLAQLGVVGCMDGDHDELDHRHHELAQPGAWVIPANVVTVADTYAIGYTGAGPWVGTSGCSGSFTSGAQVLKDWVLANWPQVTTVGGYSCRAIVGNSSAMSVHATGRAIDIHIPLDGGAADNGLGDPLANYLVENADKLGVQMVIWDRWMWSPSRSPRSRAYTGSHPHHDHLHVEITPQAARKELPWYQGGATAPQAAPCEPVPAQGRTIDESEGCFVAFGPAQYWRQAGAGMGGTLLWTNAFQSSTPSNWARWNVDIASAGVYVVEYYRTNAYAKFDSTRYRVRAGGVETDVYLDQSAGNDGWEEIGTYSFAAGPNQWVSVFDNTPGSVADGQQIVVDAIRVRPQGQPAPVPTQPDPGDPGNPGDPADPGDPTDPTTPGGTSDPPTGSQIDTGNGGNGDGPTTDDTLPPKGSYAPDVDESYHEEPEIVFEDTPPSVYLDGHSCSTARGGAASWIGVLLFLVIRRRRAGGAR